MGTEEMFKLIDPLVPALPLCGCVGSDYHMAWHPAYFLVDEMPEIFKPVAHPALLCACLNHLENLSDILESAVIWLDSYGIPGIEADPFWRNYLKTIPVMKKGPNAIREAIHRLLPKSDDTEPLLKLLLGIREE
jgi:hypothetical protein